MRVFLVKVINRLEKLLIAIDQSLAFYTVQKHSSLRLYASILHTNLGSVDYTT